jgi:hypothetical protein
MEKCACPFDTGCNTLFPWRENFVFPQDFPNISAIFPLNFRAMEIWNLRIICALFAHHFHGAEI